MRTLFLILLCIGCVTCAVLECPNRTDSRKVFQHAVVGLGFALAIWWVLAYQIRVFSQDSNP